MGATCYNSDKNRMNNIKYKWLQGYSGSYSDWGHLSAATSSLKPILNALGSFRK